MDPQQHSFARTHGSDSPEKLQPIANLVTIFEQIKKYELYLIYVCSGNVCAFCFEIENTINTLSVIGSFFYFSTLFSSLS